jgi:hypothetical protein
LWYYINDFLDNRGNLLSFDDKYQLFRVSKHYKVYQEIFKSAVFKTPTSERGNAFSALNFNDQDNQ